MDALLQNLTSAMDDFSSIDFTGVKEELSKPFSVAFLTFIGIQ